MLAAFFSHSPFAAQSAQAVSLSAHTVWQTPQVFGQSRITAPGLARHSLSPQISHCVEFLSAHLTPSHTPQLSGHVLYMKPGFLKL